MNGRSRLDKYSNLRQGLNAGEESRNTSTSLENTAGFNTSSFTTTGNTFDTTGSYRFGSNSFQNSSYTPNRYSNEDYDRLLKEQEDFLNSLDDHFSSYEIPYENQHNFEDNASSQRGPKYAAYDFQQHGYNTQGFEQPVYQQQETTGEPEEITVDPQTIDEAISQSEPAAEEPVREASSEPSYVKEEPNAAQPQPEQQPQQPQPAEPQLNPYQQQEQQLQQLQPQQPANPYSQPQQNPYNPYQTPYQQQYQNPYNSYQNPYQQPADPYQQQYQNPYQNPNQPQQPVNPYQQQYQNPYQQQYNQQYANPYQPYTQDYRPQDAVPTQPQQPVNPYQQQYQNPYQQQYNQQYANPYQPYSQDYRPQDAVPTQPQQQPYTPAVNEQPVNPVNEPQNNDLFPDLDMPEINMGDLMSNPSVDNLNQPTAPQAKQATPVVSQVSQVVTPVSAVEIRKPVERAEISQANNIVSPTGYADPYQAQRAKPVEVAAVEPVQRKNISTVEFVAPNVVPNVSTSQYATKVEAVPYVAAREQNVIPKAGDFQQNQGGYQSNTIEKVQMVPHAEQRPQVSIGEVQPQPVQQPQYQMPNADRVQSVPYAQPQAKPVVQSVNEPNTVQNYDPYRNLANDKPAPVAHVASAPQQPVYQFRPEPVVVPSYPDENLEATQDLEALVGNDIQPETPIDLNAIFPNQPEGPVVIPDKKPVFVAGFSGFNNPQPVQKPVTQQPHVQPQPVQQPVTQQPHVQPQPVQQPVTQQPHVQPQPVQQPVTQQPYVQPQPVQQPVTQQPYVQPQPVQQPVTQQPYVQPQPVQQPVTQQPYVQPQPVQQPVTQQPYVQPQPERKPTTIADIPLVTKPVAQPAKQEELSLEELVSQIANQDKINQDDIDKIINASLSVETREPANNSNSNFDYINNILDSFSYEKNAPATASNETYDDPYLNDDYSFDDQDFNDLASYVDQVSIDAIRNDVSVKPEEVKQPQPEEKPAETVIPEIPAEKEIEKEVESVIEEVEPEVIEAPAPEKVADAHVATAQLDIPLQQLPEQKPQLAETAFADDSKIKDLNKQLVTERMLREELLEETKQMKFQINEYEVEMNDVTDSISKTNKVLNVVLALLVLALFVILFVIIYWFLLERGSI